MNKLIKRSTGKFLLSRILELNDILWLLKNAAFPFMASRIHQAMNTDDFNEFFKYFYQLEYMQRNADGSYQAI